MPPGRVRINAYDQRTQPRSVATPYVRATEQAGDGLAEGLASVGQGLADVGRGLQAEEQLRIAREEDDARVYVSSAMARARAQANEINRRAFAEAPDGWRGATQRISSEWGTMRGQAVGLAPTPTAQRFLNQAFDAYQPLLLEDAATQEQAARQSWRADSWEESRGIESSAIATNPALYGQAITQRREIIAGMRDIDANTRRDLIARDEQEFATVAVSALIQRDPGAALARLRGVSATGNPEQIASLLGGTITSTQRDPAHNAEVGGVPNSMHLSGEAVDLTVPDRYRGMNSNDIEEDVRRQLHNAGIAATEVLFEGDHIHVGWRGAASAPEGQASPEERALDPYAALTGPQRLTLANQAESELERRNTRWRGDVDDRMRGALAMIEAGEQPINPPTVDEVRQARGESAAAAYEIQMQTFQVGSTMNGMTNEQLDALANTAPLAEGSETERYQNAVRRRAAQQILTLRTTDPMAYAVQQGLVDNTDDMVAAIDAGDVSRVGSLMRQRVGIANDQTQRLGAGVPANPLTEGEAQRLRGMLDGLSPEARLAALNEIRNGSGMVGFRRQSFDATRGNQVYGALVAQLYGDNPGAQAGASVLPRRAVVETPAGPISAQTAARRLMAGAALLNPPAQDTNANGRSERQPASVDMPSAAAMEGVFRNYVGDAYAEDPEGYNQAFQAFRSYYAGAASETGVNGSGLTFTSNGRGGGTPAGDRAAIDLANEAAVVAVGELRENRYGGAPGLPTRTYLPWGMSAQQFSQSVTQGWPAIRQHYSEAELSDDPSAYDYARDNNGFYTVFYHGVPVPDGQGGFVRVRPRLAQ